MCEKNHKVSKLHMIFCLILVLDSNQESNDLNQSTLEKNNGC